MPRDVGDEYADTARAERHEVVEITGDGAHRRVLRRQLQTRKLRNAAREQRRLDAPRGLELALHGHQFRLLLERASDDRIAEREDEDEDAKRLDVEPRENRPAQILVGDE